MHARIEHLLSLRDGEPVAADAREHVAHCRACTAALQEASGLRERLQALDTGSGAPVPGGWEAVRQKLAARSVSITRRAVAARTAAAASVCVIVAALAWRATDDVATTPPLAGLQPPLAVEEALALDRVAQLQSQSHALEDVLFAFGAAPAVERAGTAVPIDALEAQVQWIDHQLSIGDGIEARHAEQLWRERVDLMNSLVQLRYVEAQRIAM